MLFLVMVEPRTKRRGEIKTFMDMGVRAIEILMSQNLKTDLKILSGVNSLCEQYAAGLGIRPEHIRVGDRNEGEWFWSTVQLVAPLGANTCVHLATGAHQFIARVEASADVKAMLPGCRT